MAEKSYTIVFQVDESPEEVFAAIKQVPAWWSGEVKGSAEKVGDAFTYTVPGVHMSRQTVTEFQPGTKIVWLVTEAHLSFVKDPAEWKGTEIVFEMTRKGPKTELRFTHQGLVPEFECHEACSNAWGLLVGGNLRNFIVTGQPQPSPW